MKLETNNKTKFDAQHVTMTTKPIEQLLVSLSIPTIMSMMITTIYNIADTAFVGTLGTSQSGATGVVGGYMAILQAIAFMCGQGSGSIMSRKLGAKEKSEAEKFASTGLLMSFSLAFILAVFSFIFMNPLVKLLGATETIAPYAKIYVTWVMISAPFFSSSLTINNLLRYEGKAKLGTVALMSGGILNIIGDALLICVFKLGIAGAGISTAVSQTIAFIIITSMYFRGHTNVKLSFAYISRNLRDYVEIASTGFPSLLRQGLNSTATMMLNRGAAFYGDEAVAAMSIVGRLSFFPMAMAVGIGQGFQPISAFNYGAGFKNRVIEAFKKAIIGSTLVLFIASVPMYIFAPQLVGLLRDDPAVIVIGTRALRLMCVAQLFVPLTMMVEMGFQSNGKKKLASISSSLRSGLVFIPMLLIMPRIRGLAGIQEAQPISIIITFIICIYFLRIYIKMLKS